MPGIVGPASYPIRDPRSPKQTNGRIVNPVRFMEAGGFDGAAKWAGHISTSMSSKTNDMRLEAGGRVKGPLYRLQHRRISDRKIM